MPPAGFIIDLGDQHHRDTGVDGCGHRLRRHGFQAVGAAQGLAQPLRHIEIGREIAGVRQDHLALGVHLQGRGQRLIDLDRQRIAHHHMASLGPDQSGHTVADPGGQIHPPGLVPTPDQQLPPFVGHHLGHPRGSRFRQRPQRVAVQIDHPVRQVELRLGGGKIGGHPALLCPEAKPDRCMAKPHFPLSLNYSAPAWPVRSGLRNSTCAAG